MIKKQRSGLLSSMTRKISDLRSECSEVSLLLSYCADGTCFKDMRTIEEK